MLGCSSGRPASLSVHITVKDVKIEPPYLIRFDPAVKIVASAYFSADYKAIYLK
jgi:hypothetical protein